MPTLPSLQPPAGTALAVLEEVTSGESRQDVATKLVKIFLGQGLAVPLLDYLIARELARTSKCQDWGDHLQPPSQETGLPGSPQTSMGRRVGPPRGKQERCPVPASPWPLRSFSGPQHPLPLQLAGLQVRGAVYEGERGRGHRPGPRCALL